jgi:hypothetical protein
MSKPRKPAKRQSQASKQGKRKGGGGKLARSEVVTVRLDPKLRYLAELAARKQRRALSSFIEWAIEDVLKRITLSSSPSDADEISIEREGLKLWSVSSVERLVRLAVLHPDLVSYEDQEYWKLLYDSFLLAPAQRRKKTGELDWDWATLEDTVIPKILDLWPDLLVAMAGSPLERRQWVERMQSEVAHGKVYSDVVAKKKAGD